MISRSFPARIPPRYATATAPPQNPVRFAGKSIQKETLKDAYPMDAPTPRKLQPGELQSVPLDQPLLSAYGLGQVTTVCIVDRDKRWQVLGQSKKGLFEDPRENRAFEELLDDLPGIAQAQVYIMPGRHNADWDSLTKNDLILKLARYTRGLLDVSQVHIIEPAPSLASIGHHLAVYQGKVYTPTPDQIRAFEASPSFMRLG